MTTTTRAVPILTVDDLDAAREHYATVLGLHEVMDHGWIVTLADGTGRHQLSLPTRDQTAMTNSRASIQVDDVDAAYGTAVDRGLEIVHELQDKAWGLRRFFFRDASGSVVNVLAHR